MASAADIQVGDMIAIADNTLGTVTEIGKVGDARVFTIHDLYYPLYIGVDQRVNVISKPETDRLGRTR